MTGDNKQNTEDDYHLKVGGILYKLAIVEDFTTEVSSGGPLLFALTTSLPLKHQLSIMNLLRTVKNIRYRVC